MLELCEYWWLMQYKAPDVSDDVYEVIAVTCHNQNIVFYAAGRLNY